jgi:hypothetical protein
MPEGLITFRGEGPYAVSVKKQPAIVPRTFAGRISGLGTAEKAARVPSHVAYNAYGTSASADTVTPHARTHMPMRKPPNQCR